MATDGTYQATRRVYSGRPGWRLRDAEATYCPQPLLCQVSAIAERPTPSRYFGTKKIQLRDSLHLNQKNFQVFESG
jgi:hypothetical protein